MICFNCGGSSHISINCNKSPEFSRCPQCFKVAHSRSDHKLSCGIKAFTSTKIGGRVFAMKEVIEIEFQNTDDTFHMVESNRLFAIDEPMLWIANSDIYVQKTQRIRSVKFQAVREMDRQILVLNKNQNVVASIALLNGIVLVNNRYELDSGMVRYEYTSEPTTELIPDVPFCCLQVNNTAELFKFRLHSKGFSFEFEVNAHGVFLVDPYSRSFYQEEAVGLAIDETNNGLQSNDDTTATDQNSNGSAQNGAAASTLEIDVNSPNREENANESSTDEQKDQLRDNENASTNESGGNGLSDATESLKTNENVVCR